MSLEDNKAIVIRHIKDVLENGHVELIESYYVPDGSTPGMDTPEEWRERVLWFHKACPGFKITIIDMMADGDKVMVNEHIDLTYTVPPEQPPTWFPTIGKQVSWNNMNVFRVVDGKLISEQSVSGWNDMLVNIEVIPLEKIEQNKTAVRKFVDALNRRDTALLAEVCTPEVAKDWTEWLPDIYARFKDYHVEMDDLVADGESVGLLMSTSGFHTGEAFGLPATGKWWTNQGVAFFKFSDGKISKMDAQFDIENHIKQLGGIIHPAAA